MKNKSFILLAVFLIMGVLIVHEFRKNRLSQGFEQSYGVVNKVLGGKNGGGIQFSFDELDTKYKPVTSNSLGCNQIVKRNLKKIQKYKFPVVYLPSDQSNAEILLFESQYDKFRIPIPEELQEIVSELSECEK